MHDCRDVNPAGSLSIERSIYAQSQNWCSKHVYEVYMYIAKNFCHERSDCLTFVCAVVFSWSSYLTTTVRSNSDETGHGERTREEDRRLKV